MHSNDQRGRSYSPIGQTPVAPHRGRQRSRVNYIASVSNSSIVRYMLYTRANAYSSEKHTNEKVIIPASFEPFAFFRPFRRFFSE